MRCWVLVLVLVGCSDPARLISLPDVASDAPAIDACVAPEVDPCDPVMQVFCGAGDKCTWIADLGTTGHIGCAPDGGRHEGESCAGITPIGPCGVAIHTDDCAAGSVCVHDRCERICDPHVAASGCAGPQACTTLDGLFVGGGQFLAGVCE